MYSWSVQKYFELAHFTDKGIKQYINVKGSSSDSWNKGTLKYNKNWTA